MDEPSRQRQFEDQFHRQLRARAEHLIRGLLPADRVTIEAVPDGVDAVRATLTRLERYDRDLVEKLPGTRAVQLRFHRRILGGLAARRVACVRAQVLAPLEALLNGHPPGPVGREHVLDALARYELLPHSQRPTTVVLGSATGFTPEARAVVHAGGSPAVVLVSGRADGGWEVEAPAALQRTPWVRLVEFESQDDRLQRLLYHLERQAVQLDSRGIPVAALAETLGLPVEQTEALLRRACRSDARLLTVVHAGQVHLCRSPLSDRSSAMSLWSRIRRLLRLKPTVAERVRALTAQRVVLEQQRHEVDQRVGALEGEERQALEQGAAAASDAEKRQVAGRLVRLRRDLRRLRSQAAVFTQQIDILGTHIHNMTLAEQGRRTELPRAEELAQQAAEAEQVISELAANAELAGGIEVGAPTPAMEAEEAAILAEFEQVSRRAAAASGAPQPAATPVKPAETPRRVPAQPAAAPPADTKETAGPELG